VASARPSDPTIPRGLAVIDNVSEDEVDNSVGSICPWEGGLPALRDDWDGVEAAFAVETANSEALEPHRGTRPPCGSRRGVEQRKLVRN
jgi:hypothetical protein